MSEQATIEGRPLWEHDHPYYCGEGNYFTRGMAHRYGSWADFVENGGLLYDGDLDLNLLFRWDWLAPDPSLYVEGEEVPTGHHLSLFFMLQRKAYNVSAEVEVTPADEQAVRAWLAPRAERIRELWAPLLGEVEGGDEA